MICFKHISWTQHTFGGHKKYLGVTAPNVPPWLRACLRDANFRHWENY